MSEQTDLNGMVWLVLSSFLINAVFVFDQASSNKTMIYQITETLSRIIFLLYILKLVKTIKSQKGKILF